MTAKPSSLSTEIIIERNCRQHPSQEEEALQQIGEMVILTLLKGTWMMPVVTLATSHCGRLPHMVVCHHRRLRKT